MKITTTLTTIFLSTFFYTNVNAQNAVKDKVVGCWKPDKVEFTDPANSTPENEQGVLSSVVCLQKDGKFVTTSGGQNATGIYMISEDGKTLTQRMTGGFDEVGEIILLTDTRLELKTEEITIRMVRVKE